MTAIELAALHAAPRPTPGTLNIHSAPGGLMPKSANVYFEHHILLWKDPSVEISIKSMKGAFKRMLAGMPIFRWRRSFRS